MQLKLSDNSKVKFRKSHYNTFGLSHGLPENGGTCPGATTGKGGCLDVRTGLVQKTCYVEKLVRIYPAFGRVLNANTALVKDRSLEEIKSVCRETVQAFIQKSKGEDLYFRLHTSGDFFSKEYTQAWAEIIAEFPDVQFWVYTRSDEYAELLLGVKNLTLFLSCDPVNFDKMLAIYERNKDNHPNIGMAWLGVNAPDPNKYRWVKCPEITGKVKNTDDVGACSKCRLCVDNYKIRVKNIEFPYH